MKPTLTTKSNKRFQVKSDPQGEPIEFISKSATTHNNPLLSIK